MGHLFQTDVDKSRVLIPRQWLPILLAEITTVWHFLIKLISLLATAKLSLLKTLSAADFLMFPADSF